MQGRSESIYTVLGRIHKVESWRVFFPYSGLLEWAKEQKYIANTGYKWLKGQTFKFIMCSTFLSICCSNSLGIEQVIITFTRRKMLITAEKTRNSFEVSRRYICLFPCWKTMNRSEEFFAAMSWQYIWPLISPMLHDYKYFRFCLFPWKPRTQAHTEKWYVSWA